MATTTVQALMGFQFQFWLGAFPLLLGLWLLKRLIYD